jgi:hypothetical protein
MKFMMQGSTAVAAGVTTDNVISGQRYESPQFNCEGTLYLTGSAAGLKAELNVGGVSITPPITVNANNRVPIVPDDLCVDGWEVAAGSLIQLSITNTTAGSLTSYWKIELLPVEG